MESEPKLFSLARYQINVLLLKVLGQWPYQSKIQSFLLTFLWAIIILSLLVPQIHRCVSEPTEDVLFSNITPLMTVALSLTKVLNNIVQSNKIRKLLILMQREWSKLKPGPDYDIMLKYANDGYKYTILYCLMFYNSAIVFLLLPMRPKILFWLGLSKNSGEFTFPYPTDYWIDSDKYFFYIESHICFGTSFVVTALLSSDTLFVIFVQHACGLFTKICHRLNSIPIESLSKVDFHVEKNNDKAFWIISDCIKIHNKVIEFSELLDNTYCWGFFWGVGINTLLLTFSGIQIITHLNNLDEIIRYGPFAISQIVHILVESIISQQLMNHCDHLDYTIIMMRWYAMSRRSQKLLNLMTMRSRVVTKISAGKIFTLSVEFFGTVIKTSTSYFTLLRSMRED